MTRITALLLLSAALGLAGPARADDTHAQTSVLRSDTSARHHEMSSRQPVQALRLRPPRTRPTATSGGHT